MLPTLPQAVLLVDGYNAIGAWIGLIQTSERHGLAAARQELIEALTNYSSYQDFDTRLVFDAYARQTPYSKQVITRNLSVHYTNFGQTADSFIEIACAKFRNDVLKFHQRLIVATSDRSQQLTVRGYGAEWMSITQLAREIECVTCKRRGQQKSPGRSSSRFLAKSLDPLSQQRLAQLRGGGNRQSKKISENCRKKTCQNL